MEPGRRVQMGLRSRSLPNRTAPSQRLLSGAQDHTYEPSLTLQCGSLHRHKSKHGSVKWIGAQPGLVRRSRCVWWSCTSLFCLDNRLPRRVRLVPRCFQVVCFKNNSCGESHTSDFEVLRSRAGLKAQDCSRGRNTPVMLNRPTSCRSQTSLPAHERVHSIQLPFFWLFDVLLESAALRAGPAEDLGRAAARVGRDWAHIRAELISVPVFFTRVTAAGGGLGLHSVSQHTVQLN